MTVTGWRARPGQTLGPRPSWQCRRLQLWWRAAGQVNPLPAAVRAQAVQQPAAADATAKRRGGDNRPQQQLAAAESTPSDPLPPPANSLEQGRTPVELHGQSQGEQGGQQSSSEEGERGRRRRAGRARKPAAEDGGTAPAGPAGLPAGDAAASQQLQHQQEQERQRRQRNRQRSQREPPAVEQPAPWGPKASAAPSSSGPPAMGSDAGAESLAEQPAAEATVGRAGRRRLATRQASAAAASGSPAGGATERAAAGSLPPPVAVPAVAASPQLPRASKRQLQQPRGLPPPAVRTLPPAPSALARRKREPGEQPRGASGGAQAPGAQQPKQQQQQQRRKSQQQQGQQGARAAGGGAAGLPPGAAGAKRVRASPGPGKAGQQQAEQRGAAAAEGASIDAKQQRVQQQQQGSLPEAAAVAGPPLRASRVHGRPRQGWQKGRHLVPQRAVGKALLTMRQVADGTGELSRPAQAQQAPQQQQQEEQVAGQQAEPAAGSAPAAAVPPAAATSPWLPPAAALADAGVLSLLGALGLPPPSVQQLVATAAEHRPDPRAPLDEASARSACTFLIDSVRIPVSRLPGVLLAVPEVLAVGLEELAKRAQLLRTLWGGSDNKLKLAVLDHPQILSRAFFAQLGPALQALVSLGFSRERACRAVTKCPELVHCRRYELAAAINKAHISLERAGPRAMEFLAAFPQVMLPGGSAEVRSRVALLGEFGLDPGEAMEALMELPSLVRSAEERSMRSVVNVLRSGGLKQGEVAAVVRGFPAVLSADVSRVKTVLALVRAAGVPLSEIIEYPKVFWHDPSNYTAPRLAYIKAHRPGLVERLALVSILSRSDAEFAEFKGKVPLEEYLVFKDRWLSLYGGRFGLTPEQAAPLQRQLRQRLAQEVSEQLFSPINWDDV